jgi:hypothetical protein
MQEETNADLFHDIEIDGTARQHLASIASWAMVVVVVAVIGYLLSFIQLFTAPKYSKRSEGFELPLAVSGNDTFSVIFTIMVGLLINYFLYRFATLAKKSLSGLQQGELGRSFASLKTYFIITCVILIIVFVIVFLAAIVFAARF